MSRVQISVHARGEQEIVDRASEAVGLLVDDTEIFVAGRGNGDGVFAQRVGIRFDGGDRGLQFVRDRSDDFVLELFDLAMPAFRTERTEPSMRVRIGVDADDDGGEPAHPVARVHADAHRASESVEGHGNDCGAVDEDRPDVLIENAFGRQPGEVGGGRVPREDARVGSDVGEAFTGERQQRVQRYGTRPLLGYVRRWRPTEIHDATTPIAAPAKKSSPTSKPEFSNAAGGS